MNIREKSHVRGLNATCNNLDIPADTRNMLSVYQKYKKGIVLHLDSGLAET